MNACGTCTLCCKVLQIEEFPEKPKDSWCTHCAPGRGCKIYEDRPETCRGFECLWLASQRDAPGAMGPDLRPDRCHVVITADGDMGTNMLVHVDPAYPDAWRNGPAAKLISGRAVTGGHAIVAVKNRRIMVQADGIYEMTVTARADGQEELSMPRRIGRLG